MPEYRRSGVLIMTTFFTSKCVASLEWLKFALTKIDDNGRYSGYTKDREKGFETFEVFFLRSVKLNTYFCKGRGYRNQLAITYLSE